MDENEDWEDIPNSSGSQKWNPWPDGTWGTTYTRQYFDDCQFAVHWACEVQGKSKNSVGSERAEKQVDGKHTLRVCLGVMKCTNPTCEVVTRPKTKNVRRNTQLQAGCICGSPLQHHPCDVRIEYWVYRDGAHFRHSGYHRHEKVPTVHLTVGQRSRFKKIIREHPRMGPAQLLAGRPAIDGPGPSVADISPVLLNPRRIQYERRKILNPENKTRDQRLFPKLERFKLKHPNWTVGVHWMDKVNVIVLQSPWQRRIGLKDMIQSEAVNGVVSDACYDYFDGHNQLLILSSTFEPSHLKSWVPILMTYSNGASAVHYRIHFLYLFRGIAEQCRATKRNVTDDLFANVVDFSDAQRNGFIDGFVDFWLEFSPNDRDERQLKQAASELLKGCGQHFENQITRIARISRIVSPDQQSEFRKLARDLLRQTTMEDLLACANVLTLKFPGAKPWVGWWMRPAHASMLFLVASKMSLVLWKSLPATTNSAESMNHRVYRMIGRRNPLFYGLEGLVRIGETFERSHEAARTGHKVFYGRDPQYWKTTKFRYSWTKHSRHESRPKMTLDGRAPDTIARLTKKQKRAGNNGKEVTLDKPPTPLLQVQRSFSWQNNSCWLDSSLTALFAAASRDFPQMQMMFAGLPPGHLMLQLLKIIGTHIQQAALPGFESGGCRVLTDMRNHFRTTLRERKLTGPIGSSDATFGWLQQILAQLIALKPTPDAASKRCISFFRTYSLQVKRCSGCEAAPLEHWEVSHPKWRAQFQLSNQMHQIFRGDVGRWFNWLLDPSEWETATCWRQWDSNPFCNGKALAKEHIISIPVVLIVEVGDSLGKAWTVPSTLLPLGKRFAGNKKRVKYNITAHIYTNYTVKRGSGSHFITRYVTPDNSKIFDYDGMRHDGHA
ncbi:hypothetical protein C8R47DRAFT_1050409, partial [Mycena vitilis]